VLPQLPTGRTATRAWRSRSSRLVAVVSRCSTAVRFRLLRGKCAAELYERLVEVGDDSNATRRGELDAKLPQLGQGAGGVRAADDGERLMTHVAGRLQVAGEGMGSR
jgi:hypothetical protein